MKRDIKLLNKSLALAITAAMTITSMSPSVVMAENEFAAVEEFGDGFEAVDAVEAPTAEEAPVAEEAPAEVTEEEAGFGDEAAAEAFADESMTDEAVVAEAEAEAEFVPGTQGTPAQVTGLHIDVEQEAGQGWLNEPTLKWNAIDGVQGYEVSVKDGQYSYYDYFSTELNDFVYGTLRWVDDPKYPQTSLYDLDYLTAYTADRKPVQTVNGDLVESTNAMEAGKTYEIAVRAVNQYGEVKARGEWSAPVSYTMPSFTQITNLKIAASAIEDEEDDYYYNNRLELAYDGVIQAGRIYCQYSTDSSFKENVRFSDVYVSSTDKGSLWLWNMEEGKTYYIRATNEIAGKYLTADGKSTGDVNAAVWSNVITYTAPKKSTTSEKTLKQIAGFKLYNTTGSSFVFTFNPVLEDGDEYLLQYSKDPNFAADTIKRTYRYDHYDGKPSISKSELEAGVPYYVRAVTVGGYDENGNLKEGPASEMITVTRDKVPTVSDLAVAELRPEGYKLTYKAALNGSNAGIQYWISEDSTFATDMDVTDIGVSDDNSFTIGSYKLTPGKTYYVRARAYDTDVPKDENKLDDDYYSAFTNTVTIKPAVPEVPVSAAVANTAVTLKMNPENTAYVTGYQIQKKVGKKFTALAKVTNNKYKDSKLKADTTYTYRVRAYYVDSKTNKTVYGAWKNYSTVTWGGSLKLKAVARSTTAVKLTWTPIKKAQGYEIYRTVTNSNATTGNRDGSESDAYAKWTLVKTLKKASAKTATIKGLTAGNYYSFKVRAYKVVNNKKYYIDGSAYVNLAFGDVEITQKKQNANGTMTITWNPVIAGNGYVIEQENEITGEYETFATITKATKNSYTLPAAADEPVNYQIRAYKNGTPKKYSYPSLVTVSPQVGIVTGVTAKANNADGSITVSWNPVSGAEYYYLYRTTSSSNYYDKDTKSYRYENASQVRVFKADENATSGYSEADSRIKETTYVDRPVVSNANGITTTIYEGPKAGVTYYYYVVACKEIKEKYQYDERARTVRSLGSKAASASVTKASVAAPKMSSVKATAGKVTITWKKSANATGYEVYRSTKKSSGYTKIATTKSTVVKYADKKATKGKKYYYKVRAVSANEAGIDIYSGYSGVKSATAK